MTYGKTKYNYYIMYITPHKLFPYAAEFWSRHRKLTKYNYYFRLVPTTWKHYAPVWFSFPCHRTRRNYTPTLSTVIFVPFFLDLYLSFSWVIFVIVPQLTISVLVDLSSDFVRRVKQLQYVTNLSVIQGGARVDIFTRIPIIGF